MDENKLNTAALGDVQLEKSNNAPNVTKTERKRRFGDRKEGRRVRSLDGLHTAMPFLMKDRSDACNTFADEIDITKADALVREQIMSGKENFSLLHVILAAYVRTISQYPYLNRFVSGQRIYSRHKLEINLVVRKQMNLSGVETCIKIEFDPADTVFDVYEKFNAEYLKVSELTATDKVAAWFRKLPRLIFRWIVAGVFSLDYWGLLPQRFMDSLPFWGSAFVTSMGSLGIKPVYHHLYNIGNNPVFISYGAKRKVHTLDKHGNVNTAKVIDLKVVTDERICDGFEYAAAFKAWKKFMENPDVLLKAPERVVADVD